MRRPASRESTLCSSRSIGRLASSGSMRSWRRYAGALPPWKRGYSTRHGDTARPPRHQASYHRALVSFPGNAPSRPSACSALRILRAACLYAPLRHGSPQSASDVFVRRRNRAPTVHGVHTFPTRFGRRFLCAREDLGRRHPGLIPATAGKQEVCLPGQHRPWSRFVPRVCCRYAQYSKRPRWERVIHARQ